MPLNAASTPVAASTTLLAGYEDLRRQALDELPSGGLGMTLLLTQGIGAWMKACPASTLPVSENVPLQPSIPVVLAGDLRGEIVRILASMALAQTHAVSV